MSLRSETVDPSASSPNDETAPKTVPADSVEDRFICHLQQHWSFSWVSLEYPDLFAKPDSVVSFASQQVGDLLHLFHINRRLFLSLLLKEARAFQCRACAGKNSSGWKDDDHISPCQIPTCWRVKFKELYGYNYYQAKY